MAAREDLLCQMSAQLMTKMITPNTEQNKTYVKACVESAVLLYNQVAVAVKELPAEVVVEPAVPVVP